MVRVNLIHPKKLADQHLIAEYNEILMLIGYTKKYPAREGIPERYKLGSGHIKFFKDKLIYLKNRHEMIKLEMRGRGFVTNKKLEIDTLPKELHNDWKPKKEDFEIIKIRLKEKLNKKPKYYRYYGEYKELNFLIKLLD